MADVKYISKEGDTVDLVCFRHYGHTVDTVEKTLAANAGLSAMGAVLPKGTEFTLPDLGAPKEQARIKEGVIQLWD